MKTISVTTLGCKLNFSESSSIVREFVQNGFKKVAFGKQSDVTIINTCYVTAQAEKKSKFAVKKAKKVSPNGKIIVIGCAAQLNPEKFVKYDGVDFVAGTNFKFDIFNILQCNNEQKIFHSDVNEIENCDEAYSISERTRSFLKIQDGCDYHCTYCAVPLARGKSRNISIEEAVKNANIIAQKGIKEIVLTGVNIGDFGKTTGENFFQLIQELDKVEGIERYRISSIEPNLLTDEIIEFVANSKKFMPHFHIPLQSGSDDVLKQMHRRYNTNLFCQRIFKIKELIPDAFLGIDVIVGFPTETEQNFNETFNLLNDLPVSYLHIFPYSARPGTAASAIKESVPSEIIKNREIKLSELSDLKSYIFHKQFVGTTQSVLFEKIESDKKILGYSSNYIRVSVESNNDIRNKICNVKILNFENNIMNGIVLI